MQNKISKGWFALVLLVLLPLSLTVSCDAIFGDWNYFTNQLDNPYDPLVSSSPTPTASASPTPTPTPSGMTSGSSIDFEDSSLVGWSGSWAISALVAHGGSNSLQSSDIVDLGITSQSCTVAYSSSGTISFWYKVSSEAEYDNLRFYIDGVMATNASWSGEVAWSQASFEVAAGNHTFTWEYFKDSSGSSGSDCAWIDDIFFQNTGTGGISIVTPSPLVAAIAGAADTLTAGSDFSLSASGSDAIESWEWYLDDTLVGTGTTLTYGSSLSAGRYYTITLIGYTSDGAVSNQFTFQVQ